jgi:hypothetical protein
VVDFDALCRGDELAAKVIAAALRIPAEKVMGARVKACPQTNYSEPVTMMACLLACLLPTWLVCCLVCLLAFEH